MLIHLNKTERRILIKALNCLVDTEGDTNDYTTLYLKVGGNENDLYKLKE